MAKKKDWTIIFLIYADLRQEINKNTISIKQELNLLFRDLKEAPLNTKNNLIVIYNVIRPNRNKNNDKTYLINIFKHKPKRNNSFKIKEVYDCKNFIQKKISLASALKKVRKEYGAHQYLMLTWDHGSAFGIFKDIGDVENKISIIMNKLYKRKWDIEFNQGKSLVDILSSDELAFAISKGLNQKLDVLIMMNCFMQNVHTAYSLNSTVNYLIAPEGLISPPGYNYENILKRLYYNPNTSPLQISKLTVKTIREKFKDYHSRGITPTNEIERQGVFLIKLKEYKPIFNLIEKITEYLSTNMEKYRGFIEDSRSECLPVDYGFPYYFIDFENWLCLLKEKAKSQYLHQVCNNLHQIIKRTFISKELGENLTFMRLTTDKRKPSGIAIYFPLSNERRDIETSYYLDMKSEHQSSFIANTNWLRFIDLYYAS